jgi:hypothetical protein
MSQVRITAVVDAHRLARGCTHSPATIRHVPLPTRCIWPEAPLATQPRVERSTSVQCKPASKCGQLSIRFRAVIASPWSFITRSMPHHDVRSGASTCATTFEVTSADSQPPSRRDITCSGNGPANWIGSDLLCPFFVCPLKADEQRGADLLFIRSSPGQFRFERLSGRPLP